MPGSLLEGPARPTLRFWLRSNLIALGGHVANFVQALVLMPAVIRSAGATTYGSWILISSVLSFACGVSSLGVGYKSARYLPSAAPTERRWLYYPQLTFQAAMIALIAMLCLPTAPRVGASLGAPVSGLGCAVYLLAYTAFAQTNSYLRYTNRTFAMTVQGTVLSYGQAAVVVLVALFMPLTVNALLWGQTAVALAVTAPAAVHVVRNLGPPTCMPHWNAIRQDIRLGFPLTLAFVVDLILAIGDRYVLAMFLPLAKVGAYAAGYTIGSLPLVLPRAAGMVMPQLLAREEDGGRRANAETLLAIVLQLYALVSLPFVVGSAILAFPVLRLFADESVATDARYVVPIVAAGTVLYGLTLILSHVLFVQTRTRALLIVNIVSAIANLLLNAVLLWIFPSVLVAAIVTVVSYGMMCVFVLKAARSEWHVRVGWDVPVRGLLASAVMAVALVAFQSGGGQWTAIRTALGIPLGISTYALTLGALGTRRVLASTLSQATAA